jgi:hypothetical protein
MANKSITLKNALKDPCFTEMIEDLVYMFFFGLPSGSSKLGRVSQDTSMFIDENTIERIYKKVLRYFAIISDREGVCEEDEKDEFIFDYDLDWDSPINDFTVCTEMMKGVKDADYSFPNIHGFTDSLHQKQTIAHNNRIMEYTFILYLKMNSHKDLIFL